MVASRHSVASNRKIIPRPLAKSGPTDDTLRQCGHRAKAFVWVLNCNIGRFTYWKYIFKRKKKYGIIFSLETCHCSERTSPDTCPAPTTPEALPDWALNLWFACNRVVDMQCAATSSCRSADSDTDSARTFCQAAHCEWALNNKKWK